MNGCIIVRDQIVSVFTSSIQARNNQDRRRQMKKYIQIVVSVMVLMVLATGCISVVQPPLGQQQYYQNSGHTETVRSPDGNQVYTNYYNKGTLPPAAPVYVDNGYSGQPTYVQGGSGRSWVNPEYNRSGYRTHGRSSGYGRGGSGGSSVYVTPAPDVSGLIP